MLFSAAPNSSDIPFSYPSLSSSTYQSHFLPLLQDDLATVSLTKAEIVLWNISVRFADQNTPADHNPPNGGSAISSEFSIYVPGIRENHPRVDIGDIVHMREVFDKWKTGSGLAFEGRVTVLRKREGIIRESCTFSS